MVIVFVVDNYSNLTNGTNVTANRFAAKLRSLGHEVRIVTNEYTGEDIYTLKTRNIPVVSMVSKKQGYTFSKPNKELLKEAFDGADIVHLITPWKTSKVSIKIARKMKIPVIAAFHTPPESIIYGARMRIIGAPLAKYLYGRFKKLYKKVKHVHCPSLLIADELKRHNYPNAFHVISNGFDKSFNYKKKKRCSDCFKVIAVGRFAPEKSQDILIKAIARSKYKDKIELYLAGIGPTKKKLEKMAAKLGVKTNFNFYEKQELIEKLQEMDLYVHTSNIEIEGISCLEAIACGKVPLISNAKKSATSQFALDNRSIYEKGNIQDLTEKIEYWLLNEQERKKMEILYAESTQKYNLDNSIKRFLDMLKTAIFDYKNDVLTKTKEAKNVKKTIKKGAIKKTLSTAFYYAVLPLLAIYNKAFLKAKINNKKNLRKLKGGAVLVSNHVHNLDSVLSGLAAFPKRVTFTGMKANFQKPVAGKLVKAFGTIPTPESITETKIFFNELSKKVRSGRFVHFFPEGELKKDDNTVRDFKKGAFKLAVNSSVPIVPIRITFKEAKTITKKLKNRMVVNVGKPIFPNYSLPQKEALETLKFQTEQAMNQLAN